MWRVPKRLEGFVGGERNRTAPEPGVRGREAASPWREDSYRRPGEFDPECPRREERAAMRPDAETDRVADDCREARRDRRNDRHGNASMDCRTTVTWCGSGLALRQPGSSIRTDQTNLAAGRMAAPLRAKTAASAAVTCTAEPFSSPLRDRAGSAVRRVGKSRSADCQERPVDPHGRASLASAPESARPCSAAMRATGGATIT